MTLMLSHVGGGGGGGVIKAPFIIFSIKEILILKKIFKHTDIWLVLL